MFGLFKNTKRSPDDLIEEIVGLYANGDMKTLAELCNKNFQAIKASFEVWAKVPDHIRSVPEKLEPYANALICIADMYYQAGDESLLNMLRRDPSDNPIDQWQNQLLRAQELSETGDLEEAKKLLLAMIPELEKSTGNASEALLPKAYGHLGVVSYYLKDIEGAIGNTNKALEFCRTTNDLEGVVVYTGTLLEIMSQMGLREEDDKLFNERLDALKKLGRTEEANEFAEQYNA